MPIATYKMAGVDIAKANRAKKAIAALAKTTFTPNVIRDIGLFGGFFQLDLSQYPQPVLVASVDGVGTKLKLAFQMGIHDTIGEDLVNHCVNDIMTGGADPLFFLDYISTTKLEPPVVEAVVKGLVRGCTNAHCALIGGETAQMPGFYQTDEYDIAGTIVGVVAKERIVDGKKIEAGDILLGLPSTGLHTNGYSLARNVLFEQGGYRLDQPSEDLGMTLGEALLRVHRSYQKSIVALRNEPYLKGMSHITGGGLIDNTMRILPRGRKLRICWENWDLPPLFQLIQRAGNISADEMRQVFNMGIGYIFVVRRDAVETAVNQLNKFEDFVFIVGEVV
ncbi:phosphoribosylformylglycinamidine cyclo-ligase [candidate division KSB1 bacterium]|nr:phosphoribosylformylglycinamidine cyclo-ligase [candidate division KSB1 bacterium]